MTTSASTSDAPRTRHWADVIGIVTGISLIALSIWPSGVTASEEAVEATAIPDAVYVVRVLAGMAALAAVFLGQKWRRRTAARALMGGAGAALLVTLLVFNQFEGRALLTMLLPGVLLVVAAFAVGPMPRGDTPTAQDEARSRSR